MPDMGCGATCMKYILFIFNFIFFLAGAAVLGVGIWLKVDDKATDYITIANNANDNPAFEVALIILICVGAFIFLVGFLGCCGACKESSCMLSMYAGLMVLVIILEITVAVLAIVYKDQFEEEFKHEMAEQVKIVGTDPNADATTKAWYRIQYELDCCGAVNYLDYKDSQFTTDSGNAVPVTCCVPAEGSQDFKALVARDYETCLKEAGQDPTQPKKELYGIGCYDGFIKWIENNALVLVGIGFGLVALEIFGIVFACCVRSEINKY